MSHTQGPKSTAHQTKEGRALRLALLALIARAHYCNVARSLYTMRARARRRQWPPSWKEVGRRQRDTQRLNGIIGWGWG